MTKRRIEDLPVHSEKELRQERHREWKRLNMAALDAGPYRFTITNQGETLLFREPGRPKVDFYPSTGRWRVAGVARTFSGGGKKFLDWYQYYCDPNVQAPRSLRAPSTNQTKGNES